MKTCFILFALVILTAGAGCTKKNESKDKQATDKKMMVATVTRYHSTACLGGTILSAKFGYPRDVAIAPNGTIYVVYLSSVKLRYP